MPRQLSSATKRMVGEILKLLSRHVHNPPAERCSRELFLASTHTHFRRAEQPLTAFTTKLSGYMKIGDLSRKLVSAASRTYGSVNCFSRSIR